MYYVDLCDYSNLLYILTEKKISICKILLINIVQKSYKRSIQLRFMEKILKSPSENMDCTTNLYSQTLAPFLFVTSRI